MIDVVVGLVEPVQVDKRLVLGSLVFAGGETHATESVLSLVFVEQKVTDCLFSARFSLRSLDPVKDTVAPITPLVSEHSEADWFGATLGHKHDAFASVGKNRAGDRLKILIEINSHSIAVLREKRLKSFEIGRYRKAHFDLLVHFTLHKNIF